ncbi:MAG: cysteine protease StiP family protein [Deltaproteobacteria bacterium]|jgi:hypothetical protein|nr:cysteine protease StiP family protein [Deltaproteobacteria bacterium]
MEPFSGSFNQEDAIFLLKVIDIPPMALETREYRIQSGQSHYSEMIGPEKPPDKSYLAVFHQALERNQARLGLDLVKLAAIVAQSRPGPLTLVSIARSGTPVGVILGRLLKIVFKRDITHYSISVIRDKGVDQNALNYILERHEPQSIVFVDGWTGKGVIGRELAHSLGQIKAPKELDPNLAVLADLAGIAGLTASVDDYLIATSLLNSVVSGLISRTILNPDYIGPFDFHGCVFYQELKDYDLSKWLVDKVTQYALNQLKTVPDLKAIQNVSLSERLKAATASAAFMARAKLKYRIQDENYIKPGLGESARVLLRRAPELLIVRDRLDPDVQPVLILAQERDVPVAMEPDLPYRAAALIKRLDRDN